MIMMMMLVMMVVVIMVIAMMILMTMMINVNNGLRVKSVAIPQNFLFEFFLWSVLWRSSDMKQLDCTALQKHIIPPLPRVFDEKDVENDEKNKF